ncbi:HAD family hydrolase [Clostridium sp. 'White wine YQ']|uniref:HAD family hydrolase n=1 Tax=Clostridium sp. 'White wine YQ' TaxID=3027474 RepID=UPI0023654BEF|nr:HAD family phosphatase [Clostridium sp. 'White wine YQ']MDD7796145.1 HAD family phosphatase [Clostridium sp. 'White wine YQ']
MIKNIIFDLGNVLLDYNPVEYLMNKGIEKSKVKELINQVFLSEEWAMLDRGTITEEEAIEVLCKRSKENEDLIRLAMDNWYEILTPIEESVEILKAVKGAGYKTYILSNFHLVAHENVTKKHDFFEHFDGGVFSFKEKLLKPEEEIYKLVLDRYNMKAEETIFIDDTAINIEAANKLGINGIVFKGAEDLRDELSKYGVNI